MATLFQRLTHTSTDGSSDIGIHGFEACLYEYVRDELTQSDIATVYSHNINDSQWISLFGLIDDAGTNTQKILKVQEIIDVLIIHECRDLNSIYPNGAAVASRLLA